MRNKPKNLVIFHAGCADGFCAAWIARKTLGEIACEFVPMNCGNQVGDLAEYRGRNVYILDFSFKFDVVKEIALVAEKLVLLDHHKTAQAELAQFTEEYCRGFARPVTIRFDMSKSGGRLTWEYFHGDQPSPWLVDYTEDRDLWKWALPNSKYVNAAIRSYPFDFSVWDHELFADEVVSEGKAICRYQQGIINEAVKNAVDVVIDGYTVPSLNTTVLHSEIGEALAQGRPFAATFFIRQDGKQVWSLRSREGGIDVSEIAKNHGGGGHARAAGFIGAVEWFI